MNNLRKIAAGSLAAVLAFSMAACGSSNASSDGTGESTGKAVTVNEKSAKATSLADFGTMEDLEKAAKEEGALNVIALPHDWSNYGEVIESFKKKYPEIKVTELNPNASSKEELDAAKTNKGTDAAPDVFDVGQAIAATSTDYFAPYKVQAWDKIPDTAKDADGAYYADYTGIMSVGWNADKYGDISSLDDLLDPKFAGTVALNGKPAECLFHVILHSPETSPGKNSRVYFQFFRGNKFHRDRIHTITGILRGKTLPHEHVPQVSPTVSADNLCPPPISIRNPFHRSRNLIIKTRPPAPGIKLILRTVKRAPALFANECPFRFKIIIFTRERPLRPLINNHLFFIRCQLFLLCHNHVVY